MPEKRPTWEWVSAKLKERHSLLDPLHRAMEEDEGYHFWSSGARNALEPYIAGIPEDFELVLLPWGELAVQTGANRIVSGEEPDVTITFPDGAFESYPEKQRGQEERQRREEYIRWVRAGLRYVLGRSMVNPARNQAIKTLSLGAGPIQWPLSYKQWPDPPFGWLPEEDGKPRRPKPPGPDSKPVERAEYQRWEQQRRDSFPWVISSPHPSWVFWDPDNDPPKDYILEEEVNASTIVEDHPNALSFLRDSEDAKVVRVTYVSGDWMGQWVNGQPILRGKGVVGGVAKNMSVRPWMTVAFSGMGSTDTKASWESKVKGSIRDGRGIILALAKSVNWMAAMGETNAFPGMILRGPGARRLERELKMGPGSKTVIDDVDTTVNPMDTPKTPQEVYRLYDTATAAFAAWFGADVLRGEFRSEPTGSLRTRATLAGMPFEAPKVAIEQAWGLAWTDMLEQVKTVLREPVWVGGVTMRPERVILGTQVKIDLTPLTEEDKAFRRTAAQDDLKAGVMTKADYIRVHRGVDDATGVLRQVAIQNKVDELLADQKITALYKQKFMADQQAKLGIAPPSAPPPEGPVPTKPEQPPLPPAQIESPAPTFGTPGDAEAYARQVAGAPLVFRDRQAVQASAR